MEGHTPAFHVVTYVKHHEEINPNIPPVFSVTMVFVQAYPPDEHQIARAMEQVAPRAELILSEVTFAPIPDELNPFD